MSSKKQAGFIHLLVILVVVGLLVSAFIPITRNYNDGKSQVAGVSSEKINNATVVTVENQTALVTEKAGALSNLPLLASSGSITAGSTQVGVLPDEAINNLLASRLMDYVVNEKVESSLASIPNMVKMEVKGEVLGYWVKGTKTHKILGLIPIKTNVEAFSSAENGQVVSSTDSLLGKILNRLAP